MTGKVLYTEYGPMSGDLSYARLGDLCVPDDGVQTGPFGSQLHACDYVINGTPIVTVEHLGENRIIHSDLPCVSNEDRERLSKYTLRKGDIVFSRVGAVDRRAIVHPEEDGWLFSGRCLRVRPDPEKVDPGYLSWFFGLSGFKEYIRQIAVGATMPSLNTTILENTIIYFPCSLQEQQEIARILCALDGKIDLNRRMNETLEAIVRAIFKSWFVDFDPVHAKAEGRDLHLYKDVTDMFPSSFEDSELGEIPKGWSVGTLGDVATQSRRGVQPREIDPSTPYIALEHMPKKSIALADWGTAVDLQSSKFAFKKGEILFGKLRPYFHKVGVAPLCGVCSTDIVVVTPQSEKWFGFVIGHVSSAAFIEYANAGSTGTKMPRTSWPEMARYKVALPSLTVSEAFSEQVRPIISRIIASIHESRAIAALHSTLLPKLISGETRVKNMVF